MREPGTSFAIVGVHEFWSETCHWAQQSSHKPKKMYKTATAIASQLHAQFIMENISEERFNYDKHFNEYE